VVTPSGVTTFSAIDRPGVGMRTLLRVLGWVLAACAVVIAFLLVTGVFTVVSTSGHSMNPLYWQGDMVIVQREPAYAVGQIVAYRGDGIHALVLHRIIGGDATAGFVMKGDNNQSVDIFHPTGADIAGTAVLHIPHGGQVLHAITDPWLLGALLVLLILFGAGVHRRSTRRRRRSAMAQHAMPTARRVTGGGPSGWPRSLQIAWSITALVVVLAAALGVWALSVPSRQAGPASTTTRTVTVGWTATVPESAAYDSTTVTSPDPVFRRLASSVRLSVDYVGPAGTLAVGARLSTSNGWHTDVPLVPASAVDGSGAPVTATLDLDALQARATAAASAIGVPAGIVTVTVLPSVSSAGLPALQPQIGLQLTPASFGPVAGQQLSASDHQRVDPAVTVPATLSIGPVQLTVDRARLLAAVLAVVGLLAAAGCAFVTRRTPPLTQAQRIRSRHAGLLATVAPTSAPTDRQVVDVADFPTLARMARRYGLLILTWSRSGVHTYLLVDDTTAYRYRCGEGSSAVEPEPAAVPDRWGWVEPELMPARASARRRR
jgi:signal peptidase I